MATIEAGLDPAEFAESARRVVDACAGKDAAGCATLLAEAGLLGVLAPEEAGGLGLPLRFALPVLQAAGAGDLAFPLLETLLLARHLCGAAPDVAASLVAGSARRISTASGRIFRALTRYWLTRRRQRSSLERCRGGLARGLIHGQHEPAA